MKLLLAILMFSVGACGCAVRNSAIHGVWVVTGVRFAGVSAMSDDEAKKWIGRSLTIGNISSSLEGEQITGCRVTKNEIEAQKFFEDGFKISPSELGYDDFLVSVYEVQQSDGQEWIAPGATILVGKNLVLTCWDGAFFVLQRKGHDNSPL